VNYYSHVLAFIDSKLGATRCRHFRCTSHGTCNAGVPFDFHVRLPCYGDPIEGLPTLNPPCRLYEPARRTSEPQTPSPGM
jgi:hypothetical protein